ncbi:hypothetical protein HELRODRAFT_183604 [Helobdella robusta]|uniref:Uncharacterized protein n=1 Tax=Helobdella robusta TaxID=6412 RepID=T1FJX0_HELRO|nr:hypothetical protein HELRODRAFT_183604 [Helobdella robusta]ESO10446.1 hypothetical protein HELRODRAFT_183604 [Helobdella robusta]
MHAQLENAVVSGVHKNGVENLWRCAKQKFKRKNGTCDAYVQSYPDEFMWLSTIGDRKKRFQKALELIRQYYAGHCYQYLNADYQFLKIYFMGNSDAEVDNRCALNLTVKRTIVHELQMFLHQNDNLVNMFKIAFDWMPSDSHRSDKTPAGKHTGRFNSPTIDEVAVVIVGENLQSRDIVLHCRNSDLKRVSEAHRSYDALQLGMHRSSAPTPARPKSGFFSNPAESGPGRIWWPDLSVYQHFKML